MAEGVNGERALQAGAVGQAPAGAPRLSAWFCRGSAGGEAVDR